jgi:hypothetical protein
MNRVVPVIFKVGCYGQYVELIFFGIFKPEILNIMVIIGKMQLNF